LEKPAKNGASADAQNGGASQNKIAIKGAKTLSFGCLTAEQR
jgi:hypothetical protein